MAHARVLVLRSPGTNCNEETAYAFGLAGAACEQIHVNRLLENPRMLDEFQILCVPGGFSYGDDLGAGKVLALRLESLGDRLKAFRDADRLILGICNGFQVLLKTGLLIEADDVTGESKATLAFNRQGRFEDRWVHVAVRHGRCAFLANDDLWAVPVAHAEGNFQVAEPAVLDWLRTEGRIVVEYVDAEGKCGPYPVNPNGSIGNVAGICDRTGRVFALMPHPERHVHPWQHPKWTRRASQPEHGDGLRFFQSAVGYFS